MPLLLLNPDLSLQDFTLRIDAREAIRLAVMNMKRAYDKKHTWIAFAPGDMVLLRLHKGYTLPADRDRRTQQAQLGNKFKHQYAGKSQTEG